MSNLKEVIWLDLYGFPRPSNNVNCKFQYIKDGHCNWYGPTPYKLYNPKTSRLHVSSASVPSPLELCYKLNTARENVDIWRNVNEKFTIELTTMNIHGSLRARPNVFFYFAVIMPPSNALSFLKIFDMCQIWSTKMLASTPTWTRTCPIVWIVMTSSKLAPFSIQDSMPHCGEWRGRHLWVKKKVAQVLNNSLG